MGCSCSGMHGFGAIDQAGIDAATLVDAAGVRYWKPEIVTVIVNSLSGHCVTSTQGLEQGVASATLVSSTDPVCATMGVGPADVLYKAQSGKNLMASIGLVFPDASLVKYLFTCPDDLSILKGMSQNSPVISLSPAMYANLNKMAQDAEKEKLLQAGLGIKNWPLTIGLLAVAGVASYFAFRGRKRY
jgi:hypothetical protein